VTESTWKSQAFEWESIILSYARHKHLFRLELNNTTTANSGYDIFENKKINRRLSFETLQDIIEEMVKKGLCNINQKR
jgi:ESCRT-II complex subunit VPS25